MITVEEKIQKIKDQERYIASLKYENELLRHKLENFESIQREKCCECEKQAIADYSQKEFELFTLKDKISSLIK